MIQCASYLYLDISRLIARAGHAVPTGVDRVEFEYADYLLRHDRQRLTFVAISPLGSIVILSFDEAERFIRLTEQIWGGDHSLCRRVQWAARRMVYKAAMSRLRAPHAAAAYQQAIYLLLSHHHLNRPASIARFLRHYQARLVPMVHDLIPIEYPEYARPTEPARHEKRMNTVLALAEGVIVPSHAVARSMLHYARHRRGNLPVKVVAHGVVKPSYATGVPFLPERPYFLCLGTIEPRKNHLLLLNIWRDMVEKEGTSEVPRLVLVGRRGWENENILDMLTRCPALQGVVIEYNNRSDPEVTALLQGARGLLFPSFTEGYGLPLSEALKLNVPCICSDIPVFHEVAGMAATFVDPLDGLGWRQAIKKMMVRGIEEHRPGKRVASAQLFDWPEQVKKGLEMVEEISILTK
ncbi:glycosyl transferase family 1 [Komagataeibacter xylinus]|nr:putative glycosyl transferase, group 1 [Komagataeibacter xylinus E25]RFO99679.1 glycosyl transferase family 1 [Komagataeibacter xylinus]RFP04937.1 glycosyl transferase family 1 [Komagataeibacter xylinus]